MRMPTRCLLRNGYSSCTFIGRSIIVVYSRRRKRKRNEDRKQKKKQKRFERCLPGGRGANPRKPRGIVAGSRVFE